MFLDEACSSSTHSGLTQLQRPIKIEHSTNAKLITSDLPKPTALVPIPNVRNSDFFYLYLQFSLKNNLLY
jgi:hypothetical protein